MVCCRSAWYYMYISIRNFIYNNYCKMKIILRDSNILECPPINHYLDLYLNTRSNVFVVKKSIAERERELIKMVFLVLIDLNAEVCRLSVHFSCHSCSHGKADSYQQGKIHKVPSCHFELWKMSKSFLIVWYWGGHCLWKP